MLKSFLLSFLDMKATIYTIAIFYPHYTCFNYLFTGKYYVDLIVRTK